MNEYNQSAAYRKCNFSDWYSIQDYQYSSYAYLNNMPKLGANFNHHHPLVAQINAIANAFIHLIITIGNLSPPFSIAMKYENFQR
ncbi:MAG: hypothetical protein AB8V53_10815 [Arsenophonus endosymbiont of Dermacentor nuttalli]